MFSPFKGDELSESGSLGMLSRLMEEELLPVELLEQIVLPHPSTVEEQVNRNILFD